jgi:hypothetical protein
MDLAALPVVDGHCHPLLADPSALSADQLLDLLSEGRPGTMRAHVPHTGYFRRVLGDLARRFGVPPTLDAVLAARAAAGPDAARTLFAEARIEALLVDTGYPASGMALDRMRGVLSCGIHEVFRIERCAERLIAQGWSYEKFLGAFEDELRAAAKRCVSFKTIVAYRCGLAVRPWAQAEIAAAYGSRSSTRSSSRRSAWRDSRSARSRSTAASAIRTSIFPSRIRRCSAPCSRTATHPASISSSCTWPIPTSGKRRS